MLSWGMEKVAWSLDAILKLQYVTWNEQNLRNEYIRKPSLKHFALL